MAAYRPEICDLSSLYHLRRRQVNKPRSLTRKRRNPQSRRLAVLLLLLLLLVSQRVHPEIKNPSKGNPIAIETLP